jgi:hypothetical protein
VRNFNEFSALWRAPLFNRAFYQDVALNWRGIAARYLFLLVMLTWLVLLIQGIVSLSGYINNKAPKALETFPAITITKGVASSDVPQPYVMKGDRGEPLFVLDTTGTITNPSDAGALLLLTRTELIQDNGGGRMQRHQLRDLPDMTLNRDSILGFMRFGRNALIPAGLLCCADWSFVWRLLAALGFAAVGLAFNGAFHGGLKYKALIRLSIVSMSGPVLLDTLLYVCGVPAMCFVWPLLQILTLVYLAYAVKVAAEVVPQQTLPSAYGAPPPLPPQDLPPGSDQFP